MHVPFVHKLNILVCVYKVTLAAAKEADGGKKEVQRKIEAKKVVYTKLIKCADKEEKRVLNKVYIMTIIEATLAVTIAKTVNLIIF